MYHDAHDEKQVIATIRLRGSELEAVRQLLAQLLTDKLPDGAEPPHLTLESSEWPKEREYIALTRRIIAARRRRNECFKTPMFGEPAWDMLLALYAGTADGPRQSVGRLTARSGSPATTALRWLDYLAKEQLVVREPNPTDGRSDFVELTDKGRTAMERYLSETIRTFA